MKTLKSLWKNPTNTFQKIASEEISWIHTSLFFGCNGIVAVYYIMRTKGLLNIDTFENSITSVLVMIFVGMVYGILSNLFIGYVIKLTGKIFKAKNDLKQIYKVLSWTSFPEMISVYLLITAILMSRVLMTEISTQLQLIISLFIGISMLVIGIISVWHIILTYKGLKVAQGLNSRDAILNYLAGASIFGVINYFLINPYL